MGATKVAPISLLPQFQATSKASPKAEGGSKSEPPSQLMNVAIDYLKARLPPTEDNVIATSKVQNMEFEQTCRLLEFQFGSCPVPL